MGLIDTAPNSSDCANNLRLACAAELDAQSHYRELRSKVQLTDLEAEKKEDIIRRLDEIIKDEEQHFGSLLFCINLLNPETTKNMQSGAAGE